MLLYIVEAKKGCKKKSLNILSLAAYLLKLNPFMTNNQLCNTFDTPYRLRIMNGRIGSDDGLGKFTCVKENGCSGVDYVLCKPDLMIFYTDFSVEEPNISSDHCEIRFCIGPSNSQTQEENADDFEHIEFTYKWDSSAKEQFIQTLNLNAVQDRLHDITEGLNFVGNESDIDSNLNCFYRIIDDVCSPTFKKKIKNSKLSNNVTQTQS